MSAGSRPSTPASAPIPLEEQRALVALSLVQGVGTGRLRALLSVFGTARAVRRARPAMLARVPGIGYRTAYRIAAFDDDASVAAQLERARRVGAELISIQDPRYPYLLRQIYDPPAFFWARGDLPKTDGPERAVAVVGTRRPSPYGKRAAHDLAGMLSRLGFTVVSGLAYGIDAVAHAAVLEAGGRTIAVLGSGVDRIYPSRHRRLAHEIARTGAVISEFPLGAKPDASNFPRRNRVVSGLCLGTVVVEAYQEGGALITGRLALEQNREVFAVPGPIFKQSSAGTHRLIQQGEAKLVHGVEDILEELGLTAQVAHETPTPTNVATLAREERALCRVLTAEPMHIDALCAAADLDPSDALVHLLSLEFKGLVRQAAGKHFYLSGGAGATGTVDPSGAVGA